MGGCYGQLADGREAGPAPALKKEAEAIEEEVKAELEARGVEQVETAHYKVSWKSVSSTRLDAKALKAERPEIYERYAVSSTAKRFTVT